MNARRARFATALVIAALLMVAMIVLGLRGSLETFGGPATIKADGSVYRLNGKIAPGYGKDPSAAALTPEGLRFDVVDKKDPTQRLAVVYHGTVPDLFKPDIEVVVTGKEVGGVFVAQRDGIKTLCPSKFQARGTSHPANVPINQSSPA